MASVNKVIIMGNLGRDPEVRYAPNGDAICNISVATTSKWKDKNSGEQREETEWHRCVAYRRTAEVIGEYRKKGDPIYIEGHLKTRKWQDKDTGADRSATEVVIDSMQLLGGRSEGGGSREGNNGGSRPAQQQRPAAQQQRPAQKQQDMDEDIPF